MTAPNNIGFVRVAAAMLVLLGHSFDLTGQTPPLWFGAGVEAFAVRVFFVLSGYLISESWVRGPVLHQYLLKRVLRIIPGLAVVVVLSACLLGPALTSLPLAGYFQERFFRLYFWNIALAPFFALPGILGSDGQYIPINGSLWTLPAEFAMYLLIPLCGATARSPLRRVAFPALLAAAFASGFYFTAFAPGQVEPVTYWTSVPAVLRWAPYFFGGAAFRLWSLESRLNLQAAVLMLGTVPCLAWNPTLYQGALMLLTPYVVLAFSLAPAPLFARVGRHNDLSYGIYLYAFPIQQTIILLSHHAVGPVALAALAAPVACAFAFASWRLVEQPALRLKRLQLPPPVTAAELATTPRLRQFPPRADVAER